MNQDAVPETHADGSRESNVDLEGSDEQRAHGPLVSVENILRVGPRCERCAEEHLDILAEGKRIGSIEADPEAVAAVGSLISTKAGEDKADEGRDDGRKHQSWRATEGTARDRLEGGRLVVLLVSLLQGLVGADEAREEREDGHTNATLIGNPQVWILQ